jgi:hypothetical protein
MGEGRLKLRDAVELAIEDIFRQTTQSQAAANWQEDSWATLCSSRELLVKAASERSEAWSGLMRFIAPDTLLCASEMEPHGRKAMADAFGSAFDAIQTVDTDLVAAIPMGATA